jgi:hypothetical protein
LLIVLGSVIFLIILGLRFRKFLLLSFTRMVYGQYSFEFFQLYKRYFVRSPFQYCFRDEFINHLLFVMDKTGDLPRFKSPKDIYFENTPYFIHYKDFLKSKGNPYCFNAFSFKNPDFIIKAAGYQEKIAGSRAVTVFYFMNDLFFMGEYIFKNPRTKIKESLVSHFLSDQQIELDNFFIENTKDRIVHYQDTGFTVDIKYITEENDSISETLKAYLNQVMTKKKMA